MIPPHNLSPGDLAQLDQAHVALAEDFDQLLTNPQLAQSLADDGIAVACARLTIGIEEEIGGRMAIAGVAALATLRLVEREAEVAKLRAELARRPLVDEPGPDVTEVWDGQTDRWQRAGDGWRVCEDDKGSELAWQDLVEMWGPIFLQPTAADQ
ncbi:hypothetical protein [Micromonospora sp. NPDC005324]|uniref:hypothetical protein n=1 Tax=Micromonospora sp. NPDC005324 TaxID=3157033 RepID=UPI0033AAAC08